MYANVATIGRSRAKKVALHGSLKRQEAANRRSSRCIGKPPDRLGGTTVRNRKVRVCATDSATSVGVRAIVAQPPIPLPLPLPLPLNVPDADGRQPAPSPDGTRGSQLSSNDDCQDDRPDDGRRWSVRLTCSRVFVRGAGPPSRPSTGDTSVGEKLSTKPLLIGLSTGGSWGGGCRGNVGGGP